MLEWPGMAGSRLRNIIRIERSGVEMMIRLYMISSMNVKNTLAHNTKGQHKP